MRIRISEPALVGDLLDYFRKHDCLAIRMGSDTVAVSLLEEIPYDAARYAIGFRLTDWLTGHANASGGIID